MIRALLSQRNLSRLLIATAFVSLQACKDETGPVAVTLSLSPSTVSVVRGNTTGSTTTVNITRAQSFADSDFPNVLLSAEGLPAGVTVTFTPVSPTGDTATLTVTAASTATAGTYSITIRGQGSNINSATTGLSITVT